MKIPFSTFSNMHNEIREEMLNKFEQMYDAGWFIQGKECECFEKEFAAYFGAKHCI